MEKIIQAIADGNTTGPYQWAELRSLLMKEIEQIAQKSEDQQGINANLDFIRRSLDSYEKYFKKHLMYPHIFSAPYSIQRLSELVSKPPGSKDAQYLTAQKYFFAIERSLYVTSETKDPALLGTGKAMEIDT